MRRLPGTTIAALGIGSLLVAGCGGEGTSEVSASVSTEQDRIEGRLLDAPAVAPGPATAAEPSAEGSSEEAGAGSSGASESSAPFDAADPFGAQAMLASGGTGHDPSKEDSASEVFFGWITELELELEPEYEEQFEPLGFELLASFEYDEDDFDLGASLPEAGTRSPTVLPDAVTAYDGKKVKLRGFMNPLAFDRKGVTRFGLNRYQSGCCFGAMPAMNEWISVEMVGDERAEYAPAYPILVYGTLEVGEQINNGFVTSLYRMQAELVVSPQ